MGKIYTSQYCHDIYIYIYIYIFSKALNLTSRICLSSISSFDNEENSQIDQDA